MRSSAPLNAEWSRFNQETHAMMAPLTDERKRLEEAGLDLTPEAKRLKEKMLAARKNNAPCVLRYHFWEWFKLRHRPF